MKLTRKNILFKRALLKGNTVHDAVKIAGYSTNPTNKIGYKLMHKLGISETLDANGLDDTTIVKSLQTAITTGLGVKATNSDALKGIELSLRLKKHLSNDNNTNTQNIYITELKALSDTQLIDRLHSIEDAIIIDNTTTS